jgi:hypothetical protein
VIEGGDASPELKRTVICGLNLLVADHAEGRGTPWPLIQVILDESTTAGTAGEFEERKAGETRKYGLYWKFLCQHPNFPNGHTGFFQNCQRKEVYRSGYEVARMMAPMIVARLPGGEESRASRVDAVTGEILNFRPGERYVIDRSGARREYVPMLETLYPDWPGLRSAKLEELLCRIYARPEYGDRETPPSSPSCGSSPPPTDTSPPSSAAERWKRGPKKPPSGLPASGSGDAFGS